MKTFEIILRPKSSFLTPLQSDTIFGSICWAIKYSEGEQELVDFLEKYQISPPLIISNGFPTGFFPKPLCDTITRKEIIGIVKETFRDESKENIAQTIKKIKMIKKIPIVSKDIFDELINGLSEIDYLKRLLSQKSEVNRDNKYAIETTFYKNSINRLAGRTKEEGGLFTQDETFYSNDTTISIFVKTDDCDKDYIEQIFKFISLNGFGKRKTVGKGHFELIEIKKCTLTFPSNSNAFVSLSSFVPSINDPVDGWYEMQIKYGKLGGDYSTSKSPFKKPIRMFKAGSVFKTNDVKEYYGQMVSKIHSDEKIMHYGYAFPVGMKI